jgi:hypothetical protein
VSDRFSEVIFLPPGGGRSYQAGPMRAVFKADGEETDDRYCVSEWWLGPGEPGPGPNSHEHNVELFYVIEGTMSILAGERWFDAPRGFFPPHPGRRKSTISRTAVPSGPASSMCSCPAGSRR